MRSNSANDSDEGLFCKKNVIVMGALVALVLSAWYGYSRYRVSSGASIRDRILQQREELSKKNAKPKPTFYDMLGKVNLTPEQQAKMNATRTLPENKEGWTQRKKVLAETLTEEQMGELKKAYEASNEGDTRWDKTLKTLRSMDQKAVENRFKELKNENGEGATRKGDKKAAGNKGDYKSGNK